MTADSTTYEQWRGLEVVDSQGTKIGKVEEIYLDEQSGQPEWLSVKTGMFGSKHSFVPLTGANDSDGQVQVPYTKELVTGSPATETDKDGYMTPDEESTLFAYYREQGYQAPSGYDTSGPSTDEAMTRSEEELRVGTSTQEVGRARLRKWIETEHVSRTVPTRHETVRVESEPITEANRDRALDGPELSEEEHEVVLHDETVVAATEVVPKERVRLVKEETTSEEQVEADLRKERIASEGDGAEH
ncbi:MAG TPA: PRC and DUF2382 domain-containing protein [Acidimicrobiales bacterium]|jgi:stress response protein YsnF|nr:PRC and DUF2382 domain-containing protein [Acidimicrobiales bacterium]